MKRIAVSQRVIVEAGRHERRDALDQRWMALCARARLVPVLLPNAWRDAKTYCEALDVSGLLLTGGNDLAGLGSADEAPERDAAEEAALTFAIARELPVLGVCRGMQFLVRAFGGQVRRIPNHAGTTHALRRCAPNFPDVPIQVQSYHAWGCLREDLPSQLAAGAEGPDGSVEAVWHATRPVVGVMWHPERDPDDAAHGAALLARVFGTERSP